jgi:hypothetical protein
LPQRLYIPAKWSEYHLERRSFDDKKIRVISRYGRSDGIFLYRLPQYHRRFHGQQRRKLWQGCREQGDFGSSGNDVVFPDIIRRQRSLMNKNPLMQKYPDLPMQIRIFADT